MTKADELSLLCERIRCNVDGAQAYLRGPMDDLAKLAYDNAFITDKTWESAQLSNAVRDLRKIALTIELIHLVLVENEEKYRVPVLEAAE